jgi:hypothetical protein
LSFRFLSSVPSDAVAAVPPFVFPPVRAAVAIAPQHHHAIAWAAAAIRNFARYTLLPPIAEIEYAMNK